jgi:hypothetical protein
MGIKKASALLITFAALAKFSVAQKHIERTQQLWFAYNNQTRFSDKWGLWADFHLRTQEDFVHDLSVGIARVGLTYYLNDNTKLTAGYAYVNFFPAGAIEISQPEHRPWQQIQWHTKYPKIRLMQWLRLEERYRRRIKSSTELENAYNFNWRVRYNFFLGVPLNKKPFAPGTFSFVLNNEAHINLGKQIVYNTFDQNRFFVGFSYHTTATDNIQLGYMNVFQQLNSIATYRAIHGARLYYYHNLDLRKKPTN